MEVTYKKFVNIEKNNRVEFLLINFDYIDGSDYFARLFFEEYGFIVENKIDGWWYSIIRIHLENSTYELLWHEDTGNEIYCLNQAEEENEMLQRRLERVLYILNNRIKEKEGNVKEPIVPDFNPNGNSVQEGINPNSLISTKDLSLLDNRRLKNAVRYGGDKIIIVNNLGKVLDGHYRLKYAIKNYSAKFCQISIGHHIRRKFNDSNYVEKFAENICFYSF